MNTTSSIAFYSPITADVPEYKIGGAETGCKRTISVLEKMGYQVFLIRKPTIDKGFISYLRQSAQSLLQAEKVFSNPDIQLVYLVGYYKRNLFLEWLMTRLAEKKKKPIIYEPKNGNMITAFNEGNAFYRLLFKQVITSSKLVFCQGQSYVSFLEENFNVHCEYLPNYVMQSVLKPIKKKEPSEMINLIYFGRLSPEKNVELMIDISKLLSEKGIQNRLTLIGACEAAYLAHLKSKITNLKLFSNQIRIYGRMSFNQIITYLEQSDFFIFPSDNPKEGHSNALTEAMAFGVIPIASDVGFNREVIHDDQCIIEGFDAKEYAERIIKLLKSEDLDSIRQKLSQRVQNFYCEDVIRKKMENALRILCNHKED